MNDNKLQSPAEIKVLLAGIQTVEVSLSKAQRHQWLAKILRQTNYFSLKKKNKSIIRAYMIEVTNYSNTQLNDLIKQYKTVQWIGCRYKNNKKTFAKRYTKNDILLLIETDKQHDTLSGPLTKKLFERSYFVYQLEAYERLATISVSHIYNLRKSNLYVRNIYHLDKTKRAIVAIGERRKPKPNGQPGYIRIDTVHQGDKNKIKGVYHINAVDEVTQFEVVCSVDKISEQYLIPVLEDLLDQFPFKILGFHSDNGSEYINAAVVKLLNKLHIEFTKSRSRNSNDNALAESKNGSIIRKALGYFHIPQRYAPMINKFNREYFVPYINYHRPCFFSEDKVDNKGKIKKKYPYKNVMTPYEKLKSLEDFEKYLKPSVTFESLEAIAMTMTDLDSAKQMQTEKDILIKKILADDI